MKMGRRNFLKWSLFQGMSVTLSAGAAPVQMSPRTGLSILQGATDDCRTQFSILHDAAVHHDIFVTDVNGNRRDADRFQTYSDPSDGNQVTHAFFSGLKPRARYFLNIFDRTQQILIDRREFGTLDLSKSSLRYALCSCMNAEEHDPNIWQTMVVNKPDVIFFLGDSVYADAGLLGSGATPAHLWKRFCEARLTLEIYYSFHLIPIIATWDDHDFGLNNSNCETYTYLSESQKNFLIFFAQDPTHCQLLERGPGVSSAFRFNTQLFFLLDDRSYRKERGSVERYAHWGEQQEKWMLSLIKKNLGPTLIMNGSQIFPAMMFKESVSRDHAQQFQGLLQKLRGLQSKVYFASGDVHYSEISSIEEASLGYPTLELTSSGIHSKCIMGASYLTPNSRRVWSTGRRNYLLVESTAQGVGAEISVKCFGSKGEKMHETKFTL